MYSERVELDTGVFNQRGKARKWDTQEKPPVTRLSQIVIVARMGRGGVYPNECVLPAMFISRM